MSTLKYATVDVEATFGATVHDLGGILDAAVVTQNELGVPNVPGAIVLGPYGVAVREFTQVMTLDGVSQSAVRTNLKKLEALLGNANEITIESGDRPNEWLYARCIKFKTKNYPLNGHANELNEIPVLVTLTFRSAKPYWTDTTASQSVAFTTAAVAMPQGTAPSEPILTTDTAAAGADTIICKDYLGVELWRCVLAARSSGERYRITTALGVMTIEKYTGGVWTNSDASLTSGVFPKPLPSDPTGYQTAAWPTLQSSTGAWTADYPRRWR